MAARKHSDFHDLDLSEGDEDQSSSSEVAVDSRTAGLASHRSKRQKLTAEHSDSEEDTDRDTQDDPLSNPSSRPGTKPSQPTPASTKTPTKPPSAEPPTESSPNPPTKQPTTKKPPHRPGVIYLSRIPPFMRPSTVRALLSPHGPITRLFLTPEPPTTYAHRRRTGGNKKRSYVDGWVEFSRRRHARACADAINGRIVGGKKGGWYRDDVWNARFLKGFGWEDLMGGVGREEREREERVRVGLGREGRERGEFLRNLERGKVEGRRRAKEEERRRRRKKEGEEEEGDNDDEEGDKRRTRRTFRQNEVVRSAEGRAIDPSDETTKVLSQIF